LSICAGVCERALDDVGAGRTVGPAELDKSNVVLLRIKYKVRAVVSPESRLFAAVTWRYKVPRWHCF